MPLLTSLLGVCLIGLGLWGAFAMLAGLLALTWYTGLGLLVLFILGYGLVHRVYMLSQDDDDDYDDQIGI